MATAEGEDLLNQALGAHCRFVDFIQAELDMGVLRCIFAGEFHVTENGPQNIVEIMSDAARKSAQRFYFLRLAELLFKAQTHRLGHDCFGDISKGRDHAAGS